MITAIWLTLLTRYYFAILFDFWKVILEHYNRALAAPQSLIVESIIEKEILTSPESVQIQSKIADLLSGSNSVILFDEGKYFIIWS